MRASTGTAGRMQGCLAADGTDTLVIERAAAARKGSWCVHAELDAPGLRKCQVTWLLSQCMHACTRVILLVLHADLYKQC